MYRRIAASDNKQEFFFFLSHSHTSLFEIERKVLPFVLSQMSQTRNTHTGDKSWEEKKLPVDGTFTDLLEFLMDHTTAISKRQKGAALMWPKSTKDAVVSIAQDNDYDTAVGAILSQFPASVGGKLRSALCCSALLCPLTLCLLVWLCSPSV